METLIEKRVAEFIPDLQEDVYRAHPAIAQSELKWLERGLGYYRAMKDNPDLRRKFPAYLNLQHDLILSPSEMDRWYILPEGFDLRSKANKEAYTEAQSQFGWRIVKHEEHVECLARCQAFLDNSYIKRLWPQVAHTEASCFWWSKDLHRKARLDIMIGDKRTLMDYKLMSNPQAFSFQRAMKDNGYAAQAANYIRAAQAATGEEYRDFWFLVQDANYPYTVYPYKVDESWLEYGAKKMRQRESMLDLALKLDSWPADEPEPRILELPSYLKEELEDE